MGDFLNVATYSGKIQGRTSRCSSLTPDKEDVGTYYITDQELFGALANIKVTHKNKEEPVTTCFSASGKTINIEDEVLAPAWKIIAGYIYTRREAPATVSRYQSLSAYHKKVAEHVYGKLLALNHSLVDPKNPKRDTTTLHGLAGIDWKNCLFTSRNTTNGPIIALKTDSQAANFSLEQANNARVKGARSTISIPVSAPPKSTAVIKFNLVAPTVRMTFKKQNYELLTDFDIPAKTDPDKKNRIELALSRTSKFKILEQSAYSIAKGTVEVTVKIEVPDKDPKLFPNQCRDSLLRFLATEAFFGDLIVNYNSSEMLRFPLSKLVSLDPEATAVDTTPAITGIHPRGMYRGSSRTVTISGKNIPSGANLAINDPDITITGANVNDSGNKITARISVAGDARYGRKTITVSDAMNSEFGKVNFSVWRRGETPTTPEDDTPPPPPTPPKDPCVKVTNPLMHAGCCENHPKAPSCKGTTAPPSPPTRPPNPTPTKDPCVKVTNPILHAGCCENHPSAASCK